MNKGTFSLKLPRSISEVALAHDDGVSLDQWIASADMVPHTRPIPGDEGDSCPT